MFINFEHSSLRAAADKGYIRMVARSGAGCSMPGRNEQRPRLGLIRTRGPGFRKESRTSGYGHGSGWGMRAGFRREIPWERKLKWGTDWHGEEAGILEGEELDFLCGRQNLG